jgi:hypothetical protein
LFHQVQIPPAPQCRAWTGWDGNRIVVGKTIFKKETTGLLNFFGGTIFFSFGAITITTTTTTTTTTFISSFTHHLW